MHSQLILQDSSLAYLYMAAWLWFQIPFGQSKDYQLNTMWSLAVHLQIQIPFHNPIKVPTSYLKQQTKTFFNALHRFHHLRSLESHHFRLLCRSGRLMKDTYPTTCCYNSAPRFLQSLPHLRQTREVSIGPNGPILCGPHGLNQARATCPRLYWKYILL